MTELLSPCLDEALPHARDVQLGVGPQDGAREVMVSRMVARDVEICLELEPAEGGAFSTQISRDEAEWIDLREGDIVFARTRR